MFATVGVIGFLIDGGVLTLLVETSDAGPYIGRAISFPLAVTATWYLNRHWAFAQRLNFKMGAEYTRYFGIQIVAALINLSVFTVLIVTYASLGAHPIIPLAIGALVAMLFNFFAAQQLVFRGGANR